MATSAPLSLRAVASGASSWVITKDGAAITGASGSGNTATYRVAAAAAGDAGTYQVRFTNSGGTTSGRAATVTVSP